MSGRQVNPRWKKVNHTTWRMNRYRVRRAASGLYSAGFSFIYIMTKDGVEFERNTNFRTAQQLCEQREDAELAQQGTAA